MNGQCDGEDTEDLLETINQLINASSRVIHHQGKRVVSVIQNTCKEATKVGEWYQC